MLLFVFEEDTPVVFIHYLLVMFQQRCSYTLKGTAPAKSWELQPLSNVVRGGACPYPSPITRTDHRIVATSDSAAINYQLY